MAGAVLVPFHATGAAAGTPARPHPDRSTITRLYWATGRDDADVAKEPVLDVIKSRRVAYRDGDGQWLRLTVWSRASFRDSAGQNRGVTIALDTRGDARSDYSVEMYLGDSGSEFPRWCSLRHKQTQIRGAGELRLRHDGAMSCRIRLAALHAAHHPRWRIVSWYGLIFGRPRYAEPYDHAPDHGWYP